MKSRPLYSPVNLWLVIALICLAVAIFKRAHDAGLFHFQ